MAKRLEAAVGRHFFAAFAGEIFGEQSGACGSGYRNATVGGRIIQP